MKIDRWQLLRTKTDETTDDDDWAGTNTAPSAGILASFGPHETSEGRPITGIEVVVLAVTAARVPVNRATGTVDLQFTEVFPRDVAELGGTPGDADAVVDCSSASTTAVPLNRKVYFELNGARQWTIRVTNDASLPGTTDRLEIWWRGVSR